MSDIVLTSVVSGAITLTNVELGNTEQLINGQVDQPNLAGEVGVLKQSYWPTIYKLSYRLNKIRPCDSIDIISFLEATVGEEITLTDHAGIDWDGVITTPQAELSHGHSNSIVIDFEGNKV